jgi:hypothetical protein
MKRFSFALIAVLFLVVFSWGCSSKKTGWGNELYDDLLDYEDTKVATFNITGTFNCERCDDEELPVAGIMVEVIPKADPTNILAAKMFDGTGPFTVPNIRWKSGEELTITAMVFTEVDKAQFTETKNITVPEEDGSNVAVTINF